MSLIVVMGLIVLVAAAPAMAGQIQFTPSIQGAGTIDVVGDVDPYSCVSSDWNDANTFVCQAGTFGDELTPSTISLQALPPAEPAGHWELVGWDLAECSVVADDVCTLDSLDPGIASFTPKATFDDTKGPTIGDVIETRSGTDSRTITFELTPDETAAHGAMFACQLDGGAAENCSSGTIEYPDLAVGTHTFEVTGTDASGNPSIDQPSIEFVIDAPPTKPPTKPPASPPVTKPPVIFPTLLFPRVLGPSSVTVKVSRKRVLSLGRVRMRCPAVAGRCPGSVVLKGRIAKGGRQVAVARKRYSLRPSSTSPVKLRLTRKAARVLEAKRRLKVTASLAVRAPNVTTRKDVSVLLRAPKLAR